jgi:hypothetical protein
MVAEEALAGKVYAPVGWATHYHANYVVPYWSGTLVKAANVGAHIFYRWEGGWGRPPAFRFGATGLEPQMALMRSLTSDPSTLANATGVVPETVDAQAAALAAAAANGDAPLKPGAKPVQGSIDSFQRAVLRRYEPMTPQAATTSAMAQITQPSSTTHWALSGLPEKPQAPLGRHASADAPAAAAPAAAQPKCLEGVRRALPGVAAPPEKQAC